MTGSVVDCLLENTNTSPATLCSHCFSVGSQMMSPDSDITTVTEAMLNLRDTEASNRARHAALTQADSRQPST